MCGSHGFSRGLESYLLTCSFLGTNMTVLTLLRNLLSFLTIITLVYCIYMTSLISFISLTRKQLLYEVEKYFASMDLNA